MLFLSYLLIFIWLKEGVGPVTERSTYDTLAQCETAKQQKVTEKMDTNWQGLKISRAMHAECKEQ